MRWVLYCNYNRRSVYQISIVPGMISPTSTGCQVCWSFWHILITVLVGQMNGLNLSDSICCPDSTTPAESVPMDAAVKEENRFFLIDHLQPNFQ